jgi:mono/diheme cytochrome c family protein
MKKFLQLSLLIGAAGLTACGAGSGEGLNEQGMPITDNNGGGNQTEAVTLAELQQNIFGAICTNCHTGANAPRGLRLDSEDNSYAFLVNQAADEIPDLMRVNPGNPDQSYIIKKLEGTSDIVGGRMPLGGPYLSEAQINQVRSWISNGAPRTGTGLSENKDGGNNHVD